jgi:peptidoglycan/xylan/chitin deacetylase (PgdA/CDA1 family)
MRRLIAGFAIAAPLLLLLLWPRSPLAAVGLLALSHALLLYPTLRPNVQWLGPVITCFATEANEVWLTIDDGPADDTPAVLDVLEERGAAATFFVKGELVRSRPELVREIVAHGHSVANHSDRHPAGTFWCLPAGAIAAQIDRCSAAIEQVTGVRPRWFRAPVGMKNPAVHPALARRGMRLVGWSVRGFDSVDEDAARVAARIVPRVTAGSIVVMHQGREFSARCIARVVDELRERGYSFVIPSDDRLKTNR